LATLKDIAKLANVSISTVSKALRGSSDINTLTVKRIQKIANQLNYKYKFEVSNEDKKTYIIGVVCPEVSSMYYADILNSLQINFLKAGYKCVVMISNFDQEQEKSCIKSLINMNVYGIVFFTENELDIDFLKSVSSASGITFVIVSNNNSNDFCDNICIDDHQSVSIAVSHLVELKHTRIGYIGDALSVSRRNSYIQTLKNNGIPIISEYIVENEWRFEECGYYGMKKLLALKNPPTAIFAAYDNIAFGAMRAIYESGFSIPEDFSVIGIDNIKTSSYLYKALTSVTEPTSDLGELASELMIEKMHKQTAVRHIKLIPTLNKRETTAVSKESQKEPHIQDDIGSETGHEDLHE